MDEQGGKRRKSVEGKRQEIAEETEQDDEHASGPPRHRESLEALCSPSYLAKESSRPSSRRASIENRPECRNRLSQELIRDVEQINQQLNQLLFSDAPANQDESPKGGSLDTRRTRTPQSYHNNMRCTDRPPRLPWQTAGETHTTSSNSLPWMTAPPPSRSLPGTGRASFCEPQSSSGVVPWDDPGGSAESAGGSRASLDAVIGPRSRRMFPRRTSLSQSSGPQQPGASGLEDAPMGEVSAALPWLQSGPGHESKGPPSAAGLPDSERRAAPPWHRKVVSVRKDRGGKDESMAMG